MLGVGRHGGREDERFVQPLPFQRMQRMLGGGNYRGGGGEHGGHDRKSPPIQVARQTKGTRQRACHVRCGWLPRQGFCAHVVRAANERRARRQVGGSRGNVHALLRPDRQRSTWGISRFLNGPSPVLLSLSHAFISNLLHNIRCPNGRSLCGGGKCGNSLGYLLHVMDADRLSIAGNNNTLPGEGTCSSPV